MDKIPGLYHLNKQVGMLLALLLGVQLEVFASIVHFAPDNVNSDRIEQLDVIPERSAFRPGPADRGNPDPLSISTTERAAIKFLPSFRDDYRKIAISLHHQECTFLSNKVNQFRIFIYSIQHNIDPSETGKNVS